MNEIINAVEKKDYNSVINIILISNLDKSKPKISSKNSTSSFVELSTALKLVKNTPPFSETL